jgi:tetratricopeptide (TPR) repeat protein
MMSEKRNARLDLYDTLELDGLLALERKSPRDVDLLVSIGRHYFKRGQLDQCHAYYSKALAIDPNDGWTHLYMGKLCYGLSCYDEAASHFELAIELLPGVACPHWCLADVYDKQGYWSRTEQQYRRAVETDPSDGKAKQKLESWLAERQSVAQNIAEPSPQSDRTKP